MIKDEDSWDVTLCGECGTPIEDGAFTSTYDGLVCHLICATAAMNDKGCKEII